MGRTEWCGADEGKGNLIQINIPDGTDGYRLLWEALPRQEVALLRTEREILYGGARGGGKTAAGMAWLLMGNVEPTGTIADAGYYLHPHYRALVLRRNMSDLGDWISKAKLMFIPLGAEYTERPCQFKFKSGATIVVGHLDDSDAFSKYQGQEFARILIEELTQIPQENLYLMVLASLRTPFDELRRQVFLTCNPGGVGHFWVRERFIVNGPWETTYLDPKTKLSRIYIPAGLKDNPYIGEDAEYVGQLLALPPNIRRAWLEGDWDSMGGEYFPFRVAPATGEPPNASHVYHSTEAHFEPWYHRWLSCDWGYVHESACYKYCQEPNGRVHVYDELVLEQTTPEELGVDIGRWLWPELQGGATQPHFTLYLSPDAFGRRTEERTIADQIAKGLETVIGQNSIYIMPVLVEDHSDIFSRASLQHGAAVTIQRAANQRVPGWQYMRSLMRWEPTVRASDNYDPQLALKLFRESQSKYNQYMEMFRKPDEVLPKLWIHGDKCPRAVMAIPLAQAQDPDKGDPEDVDKRHFKGMDSIDSLRYGLFMHKFLQQTEPFEQYLAKHMAKHAAPGGLDAMSGQSKIMMARKAEADYARMTSAHGQPIYWSRSGVRQARRAAARANQL